MTAFATAVIMCPVCGSHGTVLHHDIRASLVYSCLKCLHEWQLDPADEPSQADATAAERPRAPSARSKPSHKV